MGVTKPSSKTTSFFEFWPSWVMYFPVVAQWVVLALRHRSLTVPFLANPSLHLSGMVGVPKSTLLKQAEGKVAEAILPWVEFTVDGGCVRQQAERCVAKAAKLAIYMPFACKPDIGCRGVGVKLVESAKQLENIIQRYPVGASLLCQKLASYEPEVGVFYVKDPHTGQAEIPSMTLKILPRITGDGVHTLGELIEQDSRAGKLKFLYHERHKKQWDTVPALEESIRLVFSASHSKGAIFSDARKHITPALTQAIDELMQGLPNFYYGRLDIKYKDIDSLKEGNFLEVIEVNGASAESIHIWDKDTKFREAIRALLWQYRTLFSIGAFHRKNGKQPPTLRDFLSAWKTERKLTKHYPLTD